MNALKLNGQRFGRLLVLSQAPAKNRRSQWNCRCDCGVELVVRGTHLTYRASNSCGCLARELNSQRDHGKLDIIERKRQCLLSAARCRARAKGLSCDIEKSDIQIGERCPFLDIPFLFNQGRQRSNSPTLDRIIPHLGYIKGNVRVISMKANWMKSNSTLDEFELMAKNWRALS